MAEIAPSINFSAPGCTLMPRRKAPTVGPGLPLPTPRSHQTSAPERDLYALLLEFERRAQGGAAGLAAFLSLWRERHFSYIFEVRACVL